jgi:hypothetical protein
MLTHAAYNETAAVQRLQENYEQDNEEMNQQFNKICRWSKESLLAHVKPEALPKKKVQKNIDLLLTCQKRAILVNTFPNLG